jgi:hypothetical protein
MIGASFFQLAMRARSTPYRARFRAADAALNRGIGLRHQPVDITVRRVLANKPCECTIDELRALETHLAEHAIDSTPQQLEGGQSTVKD